MKLNKTLSDLKKILASDIAKAERFAVKKDALLAALEEMNQRICRTRDAINALEGNETVVSVLKNMASNMAHDAAAQIASATDALQTPAVPQNGKEELLTPEPGFVWRKNEAGEDMLVPVAMIEAAKRQASQPAPQTAESFLLPAVEEDAWENVEDSLQ